MSEIVPFELGRVEAPIFDEEAGWLVLGAIVGSSAQVLPRINLSLNPAHFTPVQRYYYDAISSLAERGIEPQVANITQTLRDDGNLARAGGAGSVVSLATTYFCPAVDAERQVRRMHENAARMRVDALGRQLAMAVRNGSTTTEDYAAIIKEGSDFIDACRDDAPAGTRRALVEFKSPSELRAFNPPDGHKLVGDHHIQRGSPFAIAGAPGVGKSRAATALGVSGAKGTEWFGLPVHQKFKTMILQAENGPVRLKDEYDGVDDPEFDKFIRVCPPPPFGFTFHDPEFCRQLRRAIDEFAPDVFIIDPWNRATSDDKSKDYLETFNLLLALLPTGDKAPALGIVAHTRKPAAGERTNGRGLLNVLAGGYALGSVPRAAFVIQHATEDPEENRVVFTCCKNNDGQLGARSAWKRGNGLFEPVSEFDWQEFDNPGEKRRVVTMEDIEAVFAPEDGDSGYQLLTRKAAVARLEEHTQCKRTACYAALDTEGKFKARLRDKSGLLTLK